MSEFEPTSERSKERYQDKIRSMDLIKIDGRWAQIADNSIEGQPSTVIYLDDGSHESLALDEYELVEELDTHVGALEEGDDELITSEEIANIKSGDKLMPELKSQVHVFGELKKMRLQ